VVVESREKRVSDLLRPSPGRHFVFARRIPISNLQAASVSGLIRICLAYPDWTFFVLFMTASIPACVPLDNPNQSLAMRCASMTPSLDEKTFQSLFTRGRFLRQGCRRPFVWSMLFAHRDLLSERT
jgi:hypothetical protein